MKRATHLGPHGQSAFLRVLTLLLIAAYVFVGFGGEISCAKESLTAEVSIDSSVQSDKAEKSSKSAKVVVEHCYTCAPLTIPTAAHIALPVSTSVDLSFPNDPIILVEKRLLDPPPPKAST